MTAAIFLRFEAKDDHTQCLPGMEFWDLCHYSDTLVVSLTCVSLLCHNGH